MTIFSNLKSILASIHPHVTLVAVSKTKPNPDILEAYEAGQRAFGENKVQDLVAKYEALPKDIEWHFIGHLQSNKVKYLVSFTHLIHGVDSRKLLKEINKQANKANRIQPVLLQLFIADEETKFGLDKDEALALISEIKEGLFPFIELKGLMGMATNTTNEKQVKEEFTDLKNFFDQINSSELPLSILSMGMSGDYSLAIECGSNMIRVGSKIFGARNYESSQG